MRILNIYVARNFLATFISAMAILTFGMTGARLMKIFDYISSGVPASNAFTVLLYVMPIIIAFTIPWAALVSVMLVFGRMSADNEITAMRSSGISVLQIVSPIIVIAFLLTCTCLYLQLHIAPFYLGKARTLVKNVLVDQPTAIFEPGIPVKFGDLRIYIGGKDGKNISEVQVYRMGNDNNWEQDVTATHGKIETDHQKQVMKVILYDATVAAYEGSEIRHSFSKELIFNIDYGKGFSGESVTQRSKYMRFMDILARLSMDKKRGLNTADLELELNQRVALALAPIAFLLLGMPLAIRTNRRETSVGLFLSVLLAGLYYGGALLPDAFSDQAKLYPQYWVWVPPALFQIFGAFFIFKVARK